MDPFFYNLSRNFSFYDVPENVRICRGFVGAYLDQSYLVWMSNVYFIPVIAIIGILCNLLNIITFCHKNAIHMPSSLYLQTLALCDCCFLFFGTLEITPVHLDNLTLDPVFNRYYTSSVLYIRMLSSTCYKASVILVIAFNVERYMCVCHPLEAPRYCTRRNNRFVVLGTLISSILFSIQWPICYNLDKCFNIFTNSTYYMIKMSTNSWLHIYYKLTDYFSMIMFNVVPITVLCILNGFLIKTLRRVMRREESHHQPEHSTKPSSTRDIHKRRGSSLKRYAAAWNANAMLAAVVFMFFLCLGPQVPARILAEVYGPGHNVVLIYVAISQQLIFLNASLNFCLYCLVSKKYRTILRKTIKRLFQMITGRPKTVRKWHRRKSPSVNADLIEAKILMGLQNEH